MRFSHFLLLTLTLFEHDAATVDGELPEVSMTVPQLIAYYNYPVEIFEVVTADGYILTLHRIPFGRKGKGLARNVTKPIVFLQHGLIASSADWVLNLPSQSAGFVFADAGFDVWMGNSRGNWYSRKHMNLNTHSSDYWRFTWDEMSQHDLPAMIDAALRIGGQDSLYYVGHSQGTAIMFAKLSSNVDFGRKIRKFFALAPVATITHIKGLISFLGAYYKDAIESIFKVFGPHEFLGHNFITEAFAYVICGFRIDNPLCKNVLFQIAGPGSNQLNESRLLVYTEHTPAGTSTVNMVHWIQVNLAKKMQKFDYGSTANNQLHYGQPTPPVYNLSTVQVPTYLYYSPSDWVSDDLDVQESIIARMDKKYLKRVQPLANFNHFDFIYGLHARRLIYDEVVKSVRQSFAIRSKFGRH